jgi:hypothetical protein
MFGWPVSWAPDKTAIGPYSIISSLPSINHGLGQPDLDIYNWLSDQLPNNFTTNPRVYNSEAKDENAIQPNLVTRAMIPFASDFIVYDSSVWPDKPKLGENFDWEPSLTGVMRTELLKVYRTKASPPKIRAASKVIRTHTYFDFMSSTQIMPLGEALTVATIDGETRLGRQYGAIDMYEGSQQVDFDGDFEKANSIEGLFTYWKLKDPTTAIISIDKQNKWSGESSLRVENTNTNQFGFATVAGRELGIFPGIYTVQARTRIENSNWTNVTFEGYDTFRRDWRPLALCPSFISGNTSWRSWECSFVIPSGITKMRLKLNGGWVADPKKGPSVSWFDDIKVTRMANEFYQKLLTPEPQPTITYKKLSSQRYLVHVANAQKPFVLLFGEAYDGLWTARMPDGKSIEPLKAYGLINGFPIDSAGSFDVVIEYPPQSWFYTGLGISLFALALCLLYLIYDQRRKGAARVFSGNGPVSWARRVDPRVRDYMGIAPRQEREKKVRFEGSGEKIKHLLGFDLPRQRYSDSLGDSIRGMRDRIKSRSRQKK